MSLIPQEHIELPITLAEIEAAIVKDETIVEGLTDDVKNKFVNMRMYLLSLNTDGVQELKLQELITRYKIFVYVFFKVNLLMIYISNQLRTIIQNTKIEMANLQLLNEDDREKLRFLDEQTKQLEYGTINRDLKSVENEYKSSKLKKGGALNQDFFVENVEALKLDNLDTSNIKGFLERYISAYNLYKQANDDIVKFVDFIIRVIKEFDEKMNRVQTEALQKQRDAINNKLFPEPENNALRGMMKQKVYEFRVEVDKLIDTALNLIPVGSA